MSAFKLTVENHKKHGTDGKSYYLPRIELDSSDPKMNKTDPPIFIG
jgi:hypothetical protein